MHPEEPKTTVGKATNQSRPVVDVPASKNGSRQETRGRRGGGEFCGDPCEIKKGSTTSKSSLLECFRERKRKILKQNLNAHIFIYGKQN